MTSTNDQFKVLIVGCGNIGGLLDRNNSGLPLTHAGAFKAHPDFDIAGCLDPNEEKAKDFASAWDVKKVYTSVDEILDISCCVDVISICSPTHCHFSDIEKLTTLEPKLFFCEKPLTPSLTESNALVDLCERNNILLATNYTRRWDPTLIALKMAINSKEKGKLRSIVGYYNKGLLNNGSHIIDILLFLVGDMRFVSSASGFRDYLDGDPSPVVLLEGPTNMPISLIPTVPASDYSQLEIQFNFQKGKLVMEDSGLNWSERKVVSSKIFPGYRGLDNRVQFQGGYLDAMTNAVENIACTLKGLESLQSDGRTALRSQVLCDEIMGRLRAID